jgi:hypothetical protein
MPGKFVNLAMSAFAVASFAGLADLLRSGKPVSIRSFISATLNSGLLGLIMFLLWYQNFQGNVEVLIGMCGLAGIGGVTMIDFIVQMLKSKTGIKIEVKNGD